MSQEEEEGGSRDDPREEESVGRQLVDGLDLYSLASLPTPSEEEENYDAYAGDESSESQRGHHTRTRPRSPDGVITQEQVEFAKQVMHLNWWAVVLLVATKPCV